MRSLKGHKHKISIFISRGIISCVLFLVTVLCQWAFSTGLPRPETARIGVLAKRGASKCLEKWSATAQYLTHEIPGWRFEIVPLRFEQIDPYVRDNRIDFLLANSAIYVVMEKRYRVNRIATLKNKGTHGPLIEFGGVIFTRADKNTISTLLDLKGKKFAAVDKTSFGGWIMALRELKEKGIDPKSDFKTLAFLGSHDKVVQEVLQGKYDAGTVRTDTLERMAQEGSIEIDRVKILNQHKEKGFPYALSTRLYPEWPMASLDATPLELADKVAVALVSMPKDSKAARTSRSFGWTVPLNYQGVHECLKELRLPPYEHFGEVGLVEAIRQHLLWTLAILGLLMVSSILALKTKHVNRRLVSAKLALEDAKEHLETRVEERTRELSELTRSLEEEVEERARAQNALLEEKERLTVIMECMDNAVIAFDKTGRIHLMNTAAEKLLGSSREDTIGKDLFQVLRIRENGMVKGRTEILDHVIRGKTTYQIHHGEIHREKSGDKHVAASFSPVIDRTGTPRGGVAVIKDMTQVLKIQEEITRVRRLEAIGTLAGGIAHDFNNLLAIIMGNATFVRDLTKTGRHAKKQLDAIEAACNRGKRLTQKLITFSEGGAPIKETVEVEKLLRESTEFALSGSSVRPRFFLPKGLWPVRVDQDQLFQVIQNICLNASDAMAKGGDLDIGAENLGPASPRLPSQLAGRFVHIWFTDYGHGMPKEVLDRVFDPFFSTKEVGTGLGLSIAHSIMKRHGGAITVESQEGQGTTVHLFLPAEEGTVKKVTQDRSQKKEREALSKGRILVMDDEKMIANVIIAALNDLGYKVEYAPDGASLLEQYRKRPFDLVIMDLTIPGGMGGKECIGHLKAMDPDAKAVIVSGYTNDEVISDFRSYGFEAALVKPFEIQELREMVERILEKSVKF